MMSLEVDPERLFWNIDDHGWIDGTERVEAILNFEVLHHDPGAVLSIADCYRPFGSQSRR